MRAADGKRLAMTMRAAAAVGLSVGLWQFVPPASAADFSSGRIVVIVKATTSQYWATVFDGADAAAKALGVQISNRGASAETDVAGEGSLMGNAGSPKPTA